MMLSKESSPITSPIVPSNAAAHLVAERAGAEEIAELPEEELIAEVEAAVGVVADHPDATIAKKTPPPQWVASKIHFELEFQTLCRDMRDAVAALVRCKFSCCAAYVRRFGFKTLTIDVDTLQ
jgi:hypothetical protein